MTIGNKIYDLRRKRGLSQEQLGFEIDVSRQTVYKWELDVMRPTTDNIRAMCAFFEVSAEVFLNDEIDIAPPKVTVVEKPVEKESKFNKLKDPCNKIRLTLITAAVTLVTLAVIAGIVVLSLWIAIDYSYSNPFETIQVHSIQIDWGFVSIIIVALAAIIAPVTYVILKAKGKKKSLLKKAEKSSDKMQLNNGRKSK